MYEAFQVFVPMGGGNPVSRMSQAEAAMLGVAVKDIPKTLLETGDVFMALVAKVESFGSHGLQGFGRLEHWVWSLHHPSQQVNKDTVLNDLLAVGLPWEDIQCCFTVPDAERRRALITPQLAVRLLERVSEEYHQAVRQSIGPTSEEARP